jgi:uroporphyrinogen III methyltransferase/synthase
MSANTGTVYLVGAGPGDPQLLTIGGAAALRKADVVVYDRLVHPSLLDLAPRDAERVYVGKQADQHTLTQDKINGLLYKHALEGRTVVRLKGGDPFVFGRGGEEAEYLIERRISVVVIPGVTSAIAAPAYAGIPITHRDASSSFAVITGHERQGSSESSGREAGAAEERRQWDKIAQSADTLVFLMGIESLPRIAENLIRNGRHPDTPVALVRWGTWPGRQETLVGTLSDIAEKARLAGFTAPAVTVVGDVVRWRDKLRWWDVRPLWGKRIVVTRAREQASALTSRLQEVGAEAIEFPVIRIAHPPDRYAALDSAIGRLAEFDWLLFTSVNGVHAFRDRLAHRALDTRALAKAKVAAVGPATSEALLEMGVRADFIPTSFTGEEVAKQFPEDVSGKRVLLARALEGNDALSTILSERGAKVEIAPAYETVLDRGDETEIRGRIQEGTVDAVTFTSSSTVKNFVTALGPEPPSLANVAIACIGPTTAQTARELFQREPDILAEEFTIDGLVEALLRYYRER